MRKHIRVDMAVLESVGASTSGRVYRLIVEADAVELDGEITLALDTLKLQIASNGNVDASGPFLLVTDIDADTK